MVLAWILIKLVSVHLMMHPLIHHSPTSDKPINTLNLPSTTQPRKIKSQGHSWAICEERERHCEKRYPAAFLPSLQQILLIPTDPNCQNPKERKDCFGYYRCPAFIILLIPCQLRTTIGGTMTLVEIARIWMILNTPMRNIYYPMQYKTLALYPTLGDCTNQMID